MRSYSSGTRQQQVPHLIEKRLAGSLLRQDLFDKTIKSKEVLAAQIVRSHHDDGNRVPFLMFFCPYCGGELKAVHNGHQQVQQYEAWPFSLHALQRISTVSSFRHSPILLFEHRAKN